MPAKPRFQSEFLTALKTSKGIHVRAGTGTHRFIGLWFVLVGDRVFARSWSVKPKGWYRTFLKNPSGAIQLGKLEIAVRAVPIKRKQLQDAIDRAYLEKYTTRWELKYAKDLTGETSRATTLEFLPSK